MILRDDLQVCDAEQVAHSERHAATSAAFGVRLRAPHEQHPEGFTGRLGSGETACPNPAGNGRRR